MRENPQSHYDRTPSFSQRNKKLSVMKTMALALHISIGIYVFIVYYLSTKQAWTEEWVGPLSDMSFFYGITGMACVGGLLCLVLPYVAHFFEKSKATTKPQLFYDFHSINPDLWTQSLIRMTLAESVAILGLVLAMTNQTFLIMLPFAGTALILQILVGPFKKNFF